MFYKEILLDKPRRFRYDYNAIADVEERAGLGIGAMFTAERVGFHTIRLLVWGGLKWENRGLTLDAVGNMIGKYIEAGGNLADLVMEIKDCMVQAKIIQEVDEGNEEAETEK